MDIIIVAFLEFISSQFMNLLGFKDNTVQRGSDMHHIQHRIIYIYLSIYLNLYLILVFALSISNIHIVLTPLYHIYLHITRTVCPTTNSRRTDGTCHLHSHACCEPTGS